MLRVSILLALAALAGAQQQPYPILKIQVDGNSRIAPETVIRASGLTIGQSAVKDDFDAACKRLVDTGVFSASKYRYSAAGTDSAPGFDLTLTVTEVDELTPTRIEVPGFDELQIWTWLEENVPLLTRLMPANDAAKSYYVAAITRFLEGQGRHDAITAQPGIDPRTSGVITVFRPAALDRIVAVKFEGAQQVPTAMLEKALVPLVAGTEYKEAAFREALEGNLRRLFEDRGYLGVRFPRVSPAKDAHGNLTITVTIEEGEPYRISAVDLAGDNLPAGLASMVDAKRDEVVSMTKLQLDASKLQTALGRDGYIDGTVQVEHELDDARHTAHIIFAIEKGRQSRFGELKVEGLDGAALARCRQYWTLAPGAILNTERVADFERALMRDSKIRFERITHHYERRGDSGVVDVIIRTR